MKKIIYTLTVLAAAAIAAGPVFGAVILSTGFESPTFEEVDLDNNQINGVDGSATNEGIWWASNNNSYNDTLPYAITVEGDGATGNPDDSAFRLRGGDGLPITARVDLGQDISSGVVTISFKARRRFRGFKLGGYQSAVTAFDSSTAQFALWIGHSDGVHYLSWGDYYTAATIPDHNLWGDYTITLHLSNMEYDLSVVDDIYTADVEHARMNFTPGSNSLRYLVFEVYAGQDAYMYFDDLLVETGAPETENVILSTGFEAPTFEEKDSWNNQVNGVDGSATREGVWWDSEGFGSSYGQPYIATFGGWGYPYETYPSHPDYSGVYMRCNVAADSAGMRVDLGQDLTGGQVTITFNAARRFRGFKFGGYATPVDTFDSSTAKFGLWIDHSGFFYYLEPDSSWQYTGSMIPAQWLWGKYTFTLDLTNGTYDLLVVEPAGTANVTGAMMNFTPGSDSLRYLYWEMYYGQAAHGWFDNVRVATAIVPPPSFTVLPGLIDLQIGNLIEDQRYQIHVSDDLDTWTEVDSILAADTEANWTDLNLSGTEGKRFYKVGHK